MFGGVGLGGAAICVRCEGIERIDGRQRRRGVLVGVGFGRGGEVCVGFRP